MIGLKQKYNEEVLPNLREELGLNNEHEAPKLKKIVVNVGYGDDKDNKEYVNKVTETLRKITGQEPVQNEAKQSISNFDIRKGDKIGVSVTLRGENMYEFLYKLIHLTLPRTKDFKGLDPDSFDDNGNYSIGIEEASAFPESNFEDMDLMHGVQIAINTTAKDEEEGYKLLSELGIPFKDKTDQ
ncbi:MAG: 50S ribosomal protein L5 [Candidatus Magasanikbacteria bacterium]